jgi:hypothetical protein
LINNGFTGFGSRSITLVGAIRKEKKIEKAFSLSPKVYKDFRYVLCS